jgi:uncharacterized protein (UPF0335 family)
MNYPANTEAVESSQLRSIVERIERMHEERQNLADDLKEIYAEAKGNGFDVPTIKAVVKARSQDPNEASERQAIFDLYMTALGHGLAHVHEGDDQ